MPTLIDSGLWIAFTRAGSPRSIKQFIAPYILSFDAALAEPIVFEVLRHATDRESSALEAQFQTMPTLASPDDLWDAATKLGQSCRKHRIVAGSIDLLIAAVAIHHDAELITFDRDFQHLTTACNLRVKLLQRPTP